jgi:hypothetical protein
MPAMERLTSVNGAFPARVLAARLHSEGLDPELRGAIDSPYLLTVGEMARVDVYIPADQLEDARYVMLVDEVDAACEGDTLVREPGASTWLLRVVLAIVVLGTVAPILRLLTRW